jgi:HD domain
VKLVHLAGRFTRALWPGPPRAADVEWVHGILNEGTFTQFRRQPNHDQRHAIGVARDVERRLAGTEYAGDDRWLAAALLHDIGKLDARLGIYGRVVATVAGAVAGRHMADVWSTKQGFTRRVGLYLRHAELGADRIRIAQGPEAAARWAAAHHDPDQWDATDIPSEVMAVLDAADND